VRGWRLRVAVIPVVLLLVLYVGVYVTWSRVAYRISSSYGASGFYFCYPRDHDAFLFHYAMVQVFYPLIKADELMGTGRAPAKEPFWGLSN